MSHFDLAPTMARILTDYASPVQPGDYVTIVANWQTAAPLTEALVEAVLTRGGIPNVQAAALVSADYSPYFEHYLTLATDEQLDVMDSTIMHWVEKSDALFFVKAPANPQALSALDPARLARFRQSHRALSERYLQRYAEGTLHWTVVGWPTMGAAQAAEMGLEAYSRFVARACGLDQPDPVAYWQQMREQQEHLVDYLSDKTHAEIKGPGIDLAFDFPARPWISCHGELNFPDGEIFTSPVEDSVTGTVAFNFPSIYQGYRVEGVELRFENGVAIEARAAKGEEFLLSQLDMDEGARRLGEFAIGTNKGVQEVTGSILFDEKIGGSIHMALGRSYEESKGVNQSVIHWDMVHDMKDDGTIIIDDELFYKAGEFLV